MHELSIAMGIVEIAEKACSDQKAKRIDVIELQIGELAGIEATSLDFVWPMAVRDTRLEHAERVIDWVKGIAQCLECDHEFQVKSLFDSCPYCNGYFKDIKTGKELRVKSLVVS